MLAIWGNLALAADPDGVSFTQEGCNLDHGGTISMGPAGVPICSDTGYTTGNLGKSWSELDLVPHRLTAKTGPNDPSQTYKIRIGGDHGLNGYVGWDVITTPYINTAKSDASCQLVSAQPFEIDAGIIGGVDDTINMLLEIHQEPNTTCVFDYTQRLALGAHLYSGSSLQSQLMKENFDSIGQRTISLPVAEIAPQEISKTMDATQDSQNVWAVMKEANPAMLHFGDTCQLGEEEFSKTTQITVSWKIAQVIPGMVKVMTEVKATNPSTRDILVQVTDKIYGDTGGGDSLLDTATGNQVLVPAGAMVVVLEHEYDAPAGVTGLHDVATATYIDQITNVPVPGNTTAEASATIQEGTRKNAFATITDDEVISGTGLTFSVDSFSGASGSFQNGYIAGDKTTGPVTWVSDKQHDDGSVTFNKTVYLDEPRRTNGTLSDTAYLLGSDGFTDQDSATVTIDSDAYVDLTINKSISEDILQGGETATFNFDVNGQPASITLNAGETSGSTTVHNLDPGHFDVTESLTSGFTPVSALKSTDINLPNCAGSVDFSNNVDKAKAQVVKVTVPTGYEDGWQFHLSGPNVSEDGTTAGGVVNFSADLGEGQYTITETQQDGFDLTGVTPPAGGAGDINAKTCTFSVNLPGDANQTFSCSFENTKHGKLIVRKVATSPAGVPFVSTDFNFSGDEGSFTLTPTGYDAAGQAETSFDVKPGSYVVGENLALPTGWSLDSVVCDDNNSSGDKASGQALYNVEAGETVTCTFTNLRRQEPGQVIIVKHTIGGTDSFGYSSTGGASINPTFSIDTTAANPNSITFNNVTAGVYTVTEDDPLIKGYDLIDLQCDDPKGGVNNVPTSVDLNNRIATISVDDGETVTCTFTNRKRGQIILVKNTVGGDGTFTFNHSIAGLDSSLTTSGNTAQDASDPLVPGTYSISENVPAGWDLTGSSCDDGSAPGAIDLQAGETVTCTFTNTKRGQIILVKNTVGGDGTFTFNHSIAGLDSSLTTSGNTAQDASDPLVPGIYSISENVPAGWDLTGSSCDDGSAPGAIDLQAGETVTCTFTNTKRGQIILVKNTVGGDGTFTFNHSIAGLDSSLTTSGNTAQDASDPLVPGIYSISENVPAGWDLTGSSCDDGSAPGAIDLQAGETVTCTFTNTKRGQIILVKNTVGGDGTFTFNHSIAGLDSSLTTSGNTAQDASDPLVPGIYSISENVPAGWKLTGSSCDDGSAPGAIDLQAGETVTCTFTNTKNGKLIVQKVATSPAGVPFVSTDFNFNGDEGNFTLTPTGYDAAGLAETSFDVEPGSYVVGENLALPTGWSLDSVVCDDNNSSGDKASGQALYNVEAGETVTCTFTNLRRQEPGTVIIVKHSIGGTDSFGYSSTGGASIAPTFSLDTTSLNPNSITFNNVTAGVYSVTEDDPLLKGYDLIDLQCDDPKGGVNNVPTSVDLNNRVATISVDDGETVTCTFTNRKRGKIIIVKDADPTDTGQSFEFASSYQANFFLMHGQSNESGWLVPGSYNVSELTPDGWDLSGAECDDGSPVSNIDLNNGEVVTCTFYNVQRGMADVVKTVSGQPLANGDQYTFEIRLGDGTGAAIATATATGPQALGEAVDFSCSGSSSYCVDVNGMAKLRIYDNGTTPVTYAFCETNMLPGWSNNSLDGDTWFVPGGGDPNVDNSTECINFTLSPGETRHFHIDDVPPPGGSARTIGYWKNWTSCDGRGHQEAVLDENLPITLWSGFVIGDADPTIPDPDCAVAVDLLDKRDIADPTLVRDGKKKAGDPAYGLAAQYVGYLLNVNAGAGSCPAVTDAAVQAAALLAEIGFNGTGDYLVKPKGKNAGGSAYTPERAALANQLAGIFDSYNNNLLCP
ncbi:hypothetical protein PVT67_18690 [Gallaecimonas kandeliae]|uniref:MSCRAMM family protein n=1 Tax=Gallaecimonas kandeliae TaxID=3029055 RepID=UPI00264A3A64|nr:hypothetical protein [Gallaecimonas kandeliae]WKE65662.1 hypothetical protein PVT67_18690 [Gallaecimonas kandeliae]